MTRINNLNSDRKLTELVGQVRVAGLSSPMNNSGIGEGGIEVYDQGTINVSDGNLIVNGTATFDGVVNADGTITLTGIVNISGPFTVSGQTTISGDTDITGDLTVTGPTHLNGPTETTGTLDVEGVTTLKADLNVVTGGKIVAGETTIRPSGTINFGSTLTISPSGELGPATISDGFAKYTLTPGGGFYFHEFQGGAYIDGHIFGHGGLQIADLPTTPNAPNLWIDPASGVIKRSTAV